MSNESSRFEPDESEASDDTPAALRASYREVQQRVEGASNDLGRWVRRSPGQAVLAGLAVGFLVGLIFRRRDS